MEHRVMIEMKMGTISVIVVALLIISVVEFPLQTDEIAQRMARMILMLQKMIHVVKMIAVEDEVGKVVGMTIDNEHLLQVGIRVMKPQFRRVTSQNHLEWTRTSQMVKLKVS